MSGWSAQASTSPASLYRSVAHPSGGGESDYQYNQTANAPKTDMQAMFGTVLLREGTRSHLPQVLKHVLHVCPVPCTSHLLPSDQLEANIHTRPAPAARRGRGVAREPTTEKIARTVFVCPLRQNPNQVRRGPRIGAGAAACTAAVRCLYCGAVLLAARITQYSLEANLNL